MGNNQPSNINQTTTNQLPGYAGPVAGSALQGYYNYLFPGGNLRPYPNPPQQVMGFTPTQIQGMNQATNIANQGSPAAQNYNTLANQTAQGMYLNPQTNPYLAQTANTAAQGMVNQYMDATQPSIQGQFAQSGNFGSSAQATAQDAARYGLGQNLSSLYANIYGNNYQQERQNQLQMGSELPSLISSQFLAPSELLSIGNQQQQFGQQALDTNYQNAVNANNWPTQAYQNLLGQIAPAVGTAGTSTSQTPNPYAQTSALNTALGGGMGLLGLAGLAGIIK